MTIITTLTLMLILILTVLILLVLALFKKEAKPESDININEILLNKRTNRKDSELESAINRCGIVISNDSKAALLTKTNYKRTRTYRGS